MRPVGQGDLLSAADGGPDLAVPASRPDATVRGSHAAQPEKSAGSTTSNLYDKWPSHWSPLRSDALLSSVIFEDSVDGLNDLLARIGFAMDNDPML